jgi:hypothetical protein
MRQPAMQREQTRVRDRLRHAQAQNEVTGAGANAQKYTVKRVLAQTSAQP